MMDTLIRFFKLLYQYWIKFGKLLGFITTTIILFITYIVMIGPISLILRVSGKDLLDKRIIENGDSDAKESLTFWNPKPPTETSLEMSRHQF